MIVLSIYEYFLCQPTDAKDPHFNNTCPEDFTVYAQKGEQDAIATWTFDVVDHGPVNITSSKDPGIRFAEGNHTVVVTATDSAGNVGTCEFTVVVKGE